MTDSARALLRRAVAVIAESEAQHRRGVHLVAQSRERVIWTDQLIGESQRLRDELREAVVAVAQFERTNGGSPEHMLVVLKALVFEADGRRLEGRDTQLLLDDVVHWGIEAYYAA